MRVSTRIAFSALAYGLEGRTSRSTYSPTRTKETAEEARRFGCACSSCVSEQQRRDAFNKGAGMYDEDIGTDELVIGLPLIRRLFIGWNSKGRVSRLPRARVNLKYYDFNKVSLTSLDCRKK